MARKWSEIRGTFSPEVEEEIRQEVARRGVPLNYIREAKKMTQVKLAETLKISQGSVSTMEKRTDMYISTLRNYIEAMGGELEITARFPEGDFHILQFDDSEDAQNFKNVA